MNDKINTVTHKIIKVFGWVVLLSALFLAWHWYDWQLVVVLLLAFWAHNLERHA